MDYHLIVLLYFRSNMQKDGCSIIYTLQCVGKSAGEEVNTISATSPAVADKSSKARKNFGLHLPQRATSTEN